MKISWNMSAGPLAVSAGGLLVGGIAWLLGDSRVAEIAWAVGTAPVLLVVAGSIVTALRQGHTGVDIIALLSMVGSLVLGQFLAGIIIALMFSTGRALEDHARARARRELSALLGRAPKVATRYEDGGLAQVPVASLRPGDRLLIKGGEVVPVDGLVVSAESVLDESALTGESLPVSHKTGERVRSGPVNAGPPFELRALTTAAESTYAGVVRLVQSAQASKAPFVRMADRYALLFVPFTLALAALAWVLSGEPVRALAVLVVATPCPLLLAVPVAIVSGISRAARRGVLIKDGTALETLARAHVLLFDKTGTLTTGQARLTAIETTGDTDPAELLRLSASLEQVSQHVMASTIVSAARERGLSLSLPADSSESPGAGMSGVVEGHRLKLGLHDWVVGSTPPSPWVRTVLRRMGYEGCSGVFVSIDGRLAGALLLADEIRPEAPRALRLLRKAGVERFVMVSGDRADVAESIAAALGVDGVLSERSPQDKVRAVLTERSSGVTLMVGDGINDAPALAAADVGVAMGARGSGASSEAADVVVLVDRLDRLVEALLVARRTRAIALQSMLLGMGLSLVAMGFAAVGMLGPVAGALLQEGIDVASILNALRALGGGGPHPVHHALPAETVRQLRAEHQELRPVLERIQALADRLDALEPRRQRSELLALEGLLCSRLLPHEHRDDTELYPALAPLLGGEDPLGSMSRTHREIAHLGRLYQRRVSDLSEEGPDPAERRELRRLLYGLGAILQLHFAQEEELFQTVS
ncbi:Lead, cadmium, zinc and mercury transporting ATPase [Cystobacter fuscus DSM 2262]|uniref:P-type Zn(2+) transporter n=1 Tax=Cystobacter fuscus (strain ATCC 25194 / DSM 2262 / NBRC 100088 / M29) TaxID=1242864 RepID=S9P9A4_CYSF2|nr:heavy metal translocating P-type ATPase [Cystobacter fuscus]EPX59676.1 Lead, cadmium, zinc and mercury transporting ATPase [Cystobacter fuscus DSM 2262]